MPETEQTKKRRTKKETDPAVAEVEEMSIELANSSQTTALDIWRIGAEKGLDHLERVAGLFARSGLAPDRYRCTCKQTPCKCGKVDDTAIVIAMAWKHNADILLYLQNCYVVHGQFGMESKLAIALANTARIFKGPIQYTMSGTVGQNDRACTAWAIDAKSGTRCEMSCSMVEAHAQGWTKPNKAGPSKWLTMGEMMLRYRSALNMIRLYHPEILFGMRTIDELEDIHYSEAREVVSEVVHPEVAQIRQSIAAAVPASLPAAGEKSLSESIAENSRPVQAQTVAAEVVEPADQGSLFDAPEEGFGAEPEETAPPSSANASQDQMLSTIPTDPSERRAHREAVYTLYQDLASARGEQVRPITTTSTEKLMSECRRMLEQ